MTLMPYIKITRPINLLIMAVILFTIRYGFLQPLGFEVFLSHMWYLVFVLSTLLIAAGGNVVNDARDVAADRINKPEKLIVSVQMKIANALTYGQILLFAGGSLGILMGYFLDILTLTYVFPLSAILLWFYSTTLKQKSLVGNLVISFLAALMVFNVAILDILKTLKIEDHDFQIQAVWVIGTLSIFAFLVTLARELIKDLQDMPGDLAAGYKTLPIVSGPSFAKILVILSIMFVIIGLGWLVWQTATGKDWLSTTYILLALILPLFVLLFKTAPSETPVQLKRLSILLKWVMFAGALALIIFTISIKMSFGVS
jgi:4-hydroxybenzoate polyprenyltransferase